MGTPAGLHTSYPFFALTKASYITYLLPFLCPHKGLIHHIPLTLSLPSQRPSHILPFFCNHKGLIHFTLSLPSQKPHTSHTSYPFFALTKALYITYILPFLCNHKGFIHHIHLTFCLPSQRPHTPHTSYPFFAITKALYITYRLPFVCLHKGLIHHIHLTLSLPSQRPPASWWRGWWRSVAVWGCHMPRCPHTSHPGCQQGEPCPAKQTAWKGTATGGTAGKRMQGTAVNHAHLLTQVCKTQMQRGNNYNTRITLSSMAALQWHPGERSWKF